MISYTLKCEHDHTFDSWFQSAEAFDKLHAAGMVTCAVCGALGVDKSIMAPRVRPARSSVSRTEPQTSDSTPKPIGPLSAPASPAEQALAEMRKKVEENSENVGKDFATEARKIHDGESPERSIHGLADAKEARSLIEDGIPVLPLPWGNKRTN